MWKRFFSSHSRLPYEVILSSVGVDEGECFRDCSTAYSREETDVPTKAIEFIQIPAMMFLRKKTTLSG
jgi:hypothetical protein